MKTEERGLLLLLARMMQQSRPLGEIVERDDADLARQIQLVEAAEDRAAEEEKHLGRG